MHSISCFMSYASCPMHMNWFVAFFYSACRCRCVFRCFLLFFSLFILSLVQSFGIRFLSFFFFSSVDHQIAILCTKTYAHSSQIHKNKKIYELWHNVPCHKSRNREEKVSKTKKRNNKTSYCHCLNWFSALTLPLPSSGLYLAVFSSYWLVSFSVSFVVFGFFFIGLIEKHSAFEFKTASFATDQVNWIAFSIRN